VARLLHDDRDVLAWINPSGLAALKEIEMRPAETGHRLSLIVERCDHLVTTLATRVVDGVEPNDVPSD
jgi:hypothetical protein